MNSLPKFILAIAPGKRELGIAIFLDLDLVYFSVKSIRNCKSRKSLLNAVSGILQKLFQRFSIKLVITKSISQYQKLSPDLKKIVDHITAESSKNGLQVVEVSLEQIKSSLCKSKQSTEKKAFETLLVNYPELKRYWNHSSKWQNDYYAFLFSAVAVGVVYLKTFSKY